MSGFHLARNVNQAIDEVCRSQWRRAGKQERYYLKEHRFFILSNHEKLDGRGREKLADFL